MYNITYYQTLFNEYTDKFLQNCEYEKIKENLLLKIIHSNNVEKNCKQIALSENLNEEQIFIAQLCGLFHDIGRFEQYTKYNTFCDTSSIYHGKLGIDILKDKNFLETLSQEHITIILDAIYNHGLLKISDTVNGESLLFSKIVRDADKIDVYRIIAEYCQKETRNTTIDYNLEDIPIISTKILNDFNNKVLISKIDLKTVSDFKVLQLSWIYDLHFEFTRNTIAEQNHFLTIFSSIKAKNKNELLF